MLCDAGLAVCIAERLESVRALRPQLTAQVRSRAWSNLGNSLRVVGRLGEANEAFDRALLYLPSSGDSPELEALVYDQLATLRMDERRFDEGCVGFEKAALLLRGTKNREKLGRTLLNAAINSLFAGRPAEALDSLLEAAPLLDAEAEPSLAIAAVQTAVRCYLDEHQPELALNVFLLGRDLFRIQENPLLLTKIWWTEGQVLMAHGHLEAARHLFEKIRQEYVDRKFHYHCALVSLDLALVLTQLGRFAEVRALISETLPVFQSLRVHRELLASIILLTQADRQTSYLAIIREAARRLEREPGAVDLQPLA